MYNQTDGSIPVNLEKIVVLTETIIKKKINVKFKEFEDMEGITCPVGGGFSIIINTTKHPYLQRLILAHEIAHTLISYDLSKDGSRMPLNKKDSTWPHEVQEEICDGIALYLLCPTAEIKKLLKSFDKLPYQLYLFQAIAPEIGRLGTMADFFEVPMKELGCYIKRRFKLLAPRFSIDEMNNEIDRIYKPVELLDLGELF